MRLACPHQPSCDPKHLHRKRQPSVISTVAKSSSSRAGFARRGAVLVAAFLLAVLRSPGALADSPLIKALADSYGHEKLVILFPSDRTTVFDNDGEIQVQWLSLIPSHTHPGSRLELLLNGRRVPSDGKHFVLKNLKRGKHQLRARLLSARGATIIDSRPVRFYKWHAPEEQQASAAPLTGNARCPQSSC